MKLLILSDLHSNIYALNAIWAKESDCDAIYCVGDLTDYGPFPAEVIRWFREHQVKTVFGNHDRNLIRVYEQLSGDMSGIPSEDFRWVHHNCCRLTNEDVDYLKSLPETLDFVADGYYYRLCHEFAPDYARPQGIHQFDAHVNRVPLQRHDLPIRLLFGHTHRQAICQFRGDRLWMNPGSASYRRPDDPDKAAHYAVIEDGVISLRSVEYDRTPLLQATLDLALHKQLRDDELMVAFFFFGSGTAFKPVEESIREAQEQ